MQSNSYKFQTQWRVEATAEEIYDLISHPLDFPRWWPAVYLHVEEIRPADKDGLGGCVRLHTKGWLPYTLTWESCCTEAERPTRLAIRATGDFEGTGLWTIRQDGRHANVTFDWQIRAEKPVLRYFSFLLKPIFAANHQWAMAQGERGLKNELARSRKQSGRVAE